MLAKLPSVLQCKVAGYLHDCVDLRHFFEALNIVTVQRIRYKSDNSSTYDAPGYTDSWEDEEEEENHYTLSSAFDIWLNMMMTHCGTSVILPILISEEAINIEVWRRQNPVALLKTRVRAADPLEETNIFRNVLDDYLEFIFALLRHHYEEVPIMLELTVLGTPSSTRLTFRMLRDFLRSIASQLLKLTVITRSQMKSVHYRSHRTPPPRNLVPADGVTTPPFVESPPPYHVWNDKGNHWSPVSTSSPEIWNDADDWDALPHLPVLRALHISGPASMIWIGALRYVVAEQLEELLIQCWVDDALYQDEQLNKERAESLRDFITNTCISNLRHLKIIVPKRFEILTPLLLRTVIRICERNLTSVSFVHHAWNRYEFRRIFPSMKVNSDNTIVSSDCLLRASDLSSRQLECLQSVQQHLLTVAAILRDRALHEGHTVTSYLCFNWLEFGNGVGSTFAQDRSKDFPSPLPSNPPASISSSSMAKVIRELVEIVRTFPKSTHLFPSALIQPTLL